MRIKDIVKKGIISANSESSIKEVANIMKENNIGFVPITENKKIIGVITDRDIVINCIANKCEINDKIIGYINRNVITIDWDHEISEALILMSHHKIKRILVENNKKIIGILSISDLLNINYNIDKTYETIKTIWEIKNNEKHNDAEIDEFYL